MSSHFSVKDWRHPSKIFHGRLSHIAFAPREHYVDDAKTGFTFVDGALHNAHASPLDERGEVEMRKRNGLHTKP